MKPTTIRRLVFLGLFVGVAPPVLQPMIADICSEHASDDVSGCMTTLGNYIKASGLSNEADSYFRGIGDQKPDYQKAMKLHKEAAAYQWDGTTDSQFYIAMMYANGHGVKKDLDQAIAWYTKAAELGHSGSQSSLGGLYLHKPSIQNNTLAHMWKTIAVEYGGGESPIEWRDKIAKKMTPAQLEESKRLADEWIAAHRVR